jgi:hypothetical protein
VTGRSSTRGQAPQDPAHDQKPPEHVQWLLHASLQVLPLGPHVFPSTAGIEQQWLEHEKRSSAQWHSSAQPSVDFAVQLSAGVQGPLGRHSFEHIVSSGGQVASSPSQTSTTSQGSTAGRQTVPIASVHEGVQHTSPSHASPVSTIPFPHTAGVPPLVRPSSESQPAAAITTTKHENERVPNMRAAMYLPIGRPSRGGRRRAP